jgi:hypothetical protein
MVGFGTHHYRYASGREGDTFIIGFSPRRLAVVLYGIWSEYEPEKYQLVEKLGAHTTGKGCVYVKRLSEIDLGVLETMVEQAVAAPRGA